MKYSSLLIATSNSGKLGEFKQLLQKQLIATHNKENLKIYSYADFNSTEEIIEGNVSYQENAVKKAMVSANKHQLPAIADDSGLEVLALGGSPGITSRYFGGNIPFSDKRKLLLNMLNQVPLVDRVARFVCVIALATPNEELLISRGEAYGFISLQERGDKGFGYDQLFFYPSFMKTFAEMEESEKNQVSHRAKALEQLIPKILPLF